MKLVCFSNQTAGGLLCALLNKYSKLNLRGYTIPNPEHDFLKITDTPSIESTFNKSLWYQKLSKGLFQNSWVGTHYHPSIIPNLKDFESVICITTETRQSQLYRWIRYYNGWFVANTKDWQQTDDIDRIDRVRILAKNVFIPFTSHPYCTNIEFTDIVNGKFIIDRGLNTEQFEEWKQVNPWLYDNEETWAIKRFNEAEYEIINKKPYIYFKVNNS